MRASSPSTTLSRFTSYIARRASFRKLTSARRSASFAEGGGSLSFSSFLLGLETSGAEKDPFSSRKSTIGVSLDFFSRKLDAVPLAAFSFLFPTAPPLGSPKSSRPTSCGTFIGDAWVGFFHFHSSTCRTSSTHFRTSELPPNMPWDSPPTKSSHFSKNDASPSSSSGDVSTTASPSKRFILAITLSNSSPISFRCPCSG
mmetsp:Transcript_23662/g.46329  ORF Transcript_23662/g.46329 Transcript_23662/m.46329 type:complete len:200 (+) Transcript_23662:592-1191(+)